MLVTITLNPSVDRTLFVDHLISHGTNRVVKSETDAGGKGINVARIAAMLGCEVVALGFVGGGTGEFVRHVLNRESVPHDFVDVELETRLNLSIEDESEQPPTTFNERGATISEEAWTAFQTKLDQWIGRADWVSIGGSIPPGLETNVYAKLVHQIRSKGKKVCLDADGEALKLALPELPEMVKPNREEIGRLLGKNITSMDGARQACETLKQTGISLPVVSMGDQGAVVCTDNGTFTGIPPKIDPKSTIGSGDSLIGAFLAMLIKGESIETAFSWGIAAGAATALSDGASIGKLVDVQRLLAQVTIVAH